MPKDALVSILTPTYNHADYIERCIQSVLDQSYVHWELIIYDDGSSDDTFRIAQRLADKDSRIKVLRGDNKGIFRLGEHYAAMLKLSSGEYVALLDGDDWWYPQKLEMQVAAMTSNPEAVLCWSMADVANQSGSEIIYSSPSLEDPRQIHFQNQPTGAILNVLYLENCIPALTVMIRRHCLDQIGGFQQNHGQPLVDLPTLLELSCIGSFVYLPVKLGAWRTYVNQVTKTFPALIIEGRKACVVEHLRKLENEIRQEVHLSDQTILKFYNRALVIGYSRNGRYHLVKGNWIEGRKCYIQSLLHAGPLLPMWRLRSLIGLFFSFFHLDVEGLANLLGKRTYRKT